MRWIGMVAGALSLFAVAARPVRAGLYNTAEPTGVPSRNFRKFQETLILLRQIGSPEVHSPLHKRYELMATLGTRGALATLTVEQRLDLSAYLIRLQKPRDAVNLLAPAQFQERDNFLVLANLATAEQLDGQPRRALDYLADALRLWPREWSDLSEARRKWFGQIGWNEKDFRWYREVETHQLKLLRLRSKEPPTQANELPQNVDGIFDDAGTSGKLRFVGPSGQYEAGKLALEQQAKLPKNALEIVEQLLIWMPYDTRLYWLLGELFNAEGNVPAALAILEEAAAKWDPRPVSQAGFKRDAALPKLFKEHLAVLRAQPTAELKVIENAPAPTPLPAPMEPQQISTRPPVDWKSLAVGFAVGLVAAFLASWQLREIRRRR